MKVIYLILSIVLISCAGVKGQDNTVDYDGSDLQSFINNLPNNTTVVFSSQELPREETLFIKNKENLTFKFNKAVLRSKTTGAKTKVTTANYQKRWPRNRTHLSIWNSKNIRIEGLTIHGPHINGGTGDNGYVKELEAQHAIEILNSQNISVTNSELKYIYGDGIYVGRGSSNITLDKNHIHHTGRQGIAVTNGREIKITNSKFEDIRRSHIDLEPNTDKDKISNVTIDGNYFGDKRLTWIAGASSKGRISNLVVTNNTLDCPGNIIIGNLKNKNTHGPMRFTSNKSSKGFGTKSGGIWRIVGIDGFTAENNSITAQKGRNMHLVYERNSKNIELKNNEVPNGTNDVITFTKKQ